MNHLNANPFRSADADRFNPAENTPDVSNPALVSAHVYLKLRGPELKSKLPSVADA